MQAGKRCLRAVRRAEVAERRARIAKLYLGGKSQPQISRELGIAQSTVSEDIAAMVVEWKRQAGVDVAARRAEELSKLNVVESTAWDSFEQSKQQKRVATASKKTDVDGQAVVASLTKIDRNEGDPRFLKLILDCIAKRCVILGLVGGEKEEDKNKGSFKTLEECVVAHSQSAGQNGKGGAQKATQPSLLRLDPTRLP